MVTTSSIICKRPSGFSAFYLMFTTLSIFGLRLRRKNGANPAMAAQLTGPVGTQMMMANFAALALMAITLWPAGKSAATVKVNCLAWAFFGLGGPRHHPAQCQDGPDDERQGDPVPRLQRRLGHRVPLRVLHDGGGEGEEALSPSAAAACGGRLSARSYI